MTSAHMGVSDNRRKIDRELRLQRGNLPDLDIVGKDTENCK